MVTWCVIYPLELFKFMTSFQKVFQSPAIKEIIKGALIKCQLFSMQNSLLSEYGDGDSSSIVNADWWNVTDAK